MNINEAGINLIKSFESCRLSAYQDSVGIWTVGFGHTGDDVEEGVTWDQEKADAQLEKDLQHFSDGVTDLVTVEGITDNEFSALVCFAYNCGLAALGRSHLLAKVNSGDTDGASLEFAKWNKAGGVEVAGLTRRRAAEKALFLTADGS